MKRYIWLVAAMFAVAVHAENTPPAKEKGEPPGSWTDPVLSSMKVASRRYQLERMQDFCTHQNAPSAGAIQKARGEWVVDHSILLEKVPSILRAGLSPQDMQDMNAKFRADCDENDNKIAAMPPADIVKWCGQLPARFASPEMNLMNNRDLVNSIAKINPDALVALASQPRGYNTTTTNARVTRRPRVVVISY